MLLPLYLNALGASRAEIGRIMAASAVAGLLTRPFVGMALDRWGRRPTLALGTLLAALSLWSWAWIDSLGVPVYLNRLAFGAGAGSLFAGYFTVAADLVPPTRRTEGLALFGIFGLLPLGLSPPLGGLAVDPLQLRLVFPLVGCIVAASLIPLWILQEPPRAAPPTDTPPASAWRALTHPSLWPAWLATMTFAALVAVFMAFATVCAEDRSIPHAPTLWTAYATGAIGIRLLGARLPDRLGPRNLVAPALAAYCLGLLIAARALTLPGFLLAGFCAGLGHGYAFPVLTSTVVQRSPAHRRGAALAAFTGLWNLSEILAPPLCGPLADRFGDATLFCATALAATAALAAWSALEHRLGETPTTPPAPAASRPRDTSPAPGRSAD